jgi:hypothetical protein
MRANSTAQSTNPTTRLPDYPIIQLALLVALSLSVAACREPAKPAMSEAASETVAWKPLGAWSGHGVMQTEAFISDTGSLRITWETGNEAVPGKGVFTVALHSGVSGRPLLEAVSHQGPGRDVAYVTEDPREFFLVIESLNLDWSVSVDEGFPATRAQPSAR